MSAPKSIGIALALACAACGSAALGTEYRSIGERPAIIYDAPSQKANKLAILGRFYPVEIVVKLDKWSKMRAAGGEVAWVENAALADKRWVLVSVPNAEVRAQPNPTAAIVFQAQQDVVLEPTGASSNGWLPVRHRDGQQGFVKSSQVWGE